MKIKKQYIIIGFVVIVVFILGILYFNVCNKKELHIVVPLEQNQTRNSIDNKAQISTTEINKEKSLQIPIDSNNIKVSLIVSDKKYETNIKENSSVFEAMEKIQKESTNNNPFNFKHTEYSSLGSFINEINGIKGTPGKYWIYYINNTEASVGVSKYILKDGDSILWKQD